MSEEFLKTQIISPDNQVYDGNTEMVVLPGDEGDFAACLLYTSDAADEV